MNDGEKLRCARCSRGFIVFEEDDGVADELCPGCWCEWNFGEESIDMAPMPNVNELVTYDPDSYLRGDVPINQ